MDGEVVEGAASVDESAITGESAPVIRESGGDFSSVTGGTRVLSDWIVVQVSVNPGDTFLDRMISMVEGAKRQKTPNEIALTILLVALTLVFLVVIVTLLPFSLYSVETAKLGAPITITALVALLVCLIPTTIGGLLSAIGVAGMSRMMQANVIATSGRAVEAAGDVDILLLDKTGTITLGNRQASAFFPAPQVTEEELADAAQLASLADETPEGRSIVVLAKQRFNFRQRDIQRLNAHFVAFSAQTRMSGVNLGDRELRKGAADAIKRYVLGQERTFPQAVTDIVERVAKQGSTPLVVADAGKVLGVVELKDIVKGGIKERFASLRHMGIKTTMITGDNPLTAAAIAAESGVDDFLAEATPEAKLALIRKHQARRSPRGDDRRRNERRPRARAGRCRRGDEHGYPGGERSREHGRPRFQSHQTDRNRRDRQADADDPRLADHFQHRERRRQIFRHYSGRVCIHLPAARGAEHHASENAQFRHPIRGHIQRLDHCFVDSSGDQGRQISAARRGRSCCVGT